MIHPSLQSPERRKWLEWRIGPPIQPLGLLGSEEAGFGSWLMCALEEGGPPCKAGVGDGWRGMTRVRQKGGGRRMVKSAPCFSFENGAQGSGFCAGCVLIAGCVLMATDGRSLCVKAKCGTRTAQHVSSSCIRGAGFEQGHREDNERTAATFFET